ncbi:His Kinase A (phospho-acceptor) domain-containing protein [Desulfuromusa kysingii]|uniref:histidine kinase n=1 Tax=Desulfuromusa kysingii TaxID=37625 RepID=A0A1H3VI99_9BACT|nr:ATP-binding protein [Desulfuromusa kysingii]SDZ74496.1 His Kinase A (phospho-acceptor) domain-containing protein [Desulfuromusa kysingii]
MKIYRHRLFWRVYLNSLLLIIAIIVAATGSIYLSQPESGLYPYSTRLHKVLAVELSLNLDNQAELQKLIIPLADALGRDAAIYTRTGELLASAGNTVLPALSEDKLGRLGSWHPLKQDSGQWVYTIPLGGGDSAYMLVKGQQHCFLYSPGLVLLAVALFTWPLARNFVKPLERLTETSRTIANGDLSARSGIDRKDEVGLLAHSLDEMAAQLEERIRNEKELFTNISHEIRTPLARLRFALELCEDDSDQTSHTYKHLQGMESDLNELETLVNNVLVNGRLDAVASGKGTVPVHLKHVALNTFFAAVTERFDRHHTSHQLKTSVADNMPEASIDPILINRLCDNLLENAVHYSEPGSCIDFQVKIEGNRLKVTVADSGEGVREEDLQRLFDPFFRGDRSRSRQTGGSGLGLTLCKRIVEAHSGKISAQLNPNVGMNFQFEIPLSTMS